MHKIREKLNTSGEICTYRVIYTKIMPLILALTILLAACSQEPAEPPQATPVEPAPKQGAYLEWRQGVEERARGSN